MFAARNLQKHCLKTLSSLLQSNPNRNVVAFKDTAPKLISSNVIQLDGCFEDNFASFSSFTDPFNGWFRMMSTSRGRSMRSKVERRMQKESGNASSIEEPCKIRVKYGRQYNRHRSQWCSKLGGFFCACLVKEDCYKDEDLLQQQSGEEDALFCTLCNAEWLNNCVGRKNYISFVCLMAASLVWLIVEFGVGIVVLVRCFTDRKGTESEITEKLGVGFSRPPFATVVTYEEYLEAHGRTSKQLCRPVMIPSPTVQESTSGKHGDDSNSSLVTDRRHSLLLCYLNSNLD